MMKISEPKLNNNTRIVKDPRKGPKPNLFIALNQDLPVDDAE